MRNFTSKTISYYAIFGCRNVLFLLLIIGVLLIWSCVDSKNVVLVMIIPDDYSEGEEYSIVLDRSHCISPTVSSEGVVTYRYSKEGNFYNTFEYFRIPSQRIIVTESGEVLETIDIAGGRMELVNDVAEEPLKIAHQNFADNDARTEDGSISGSANGAKMRLGFYR